MEMKITKTAGEKGGDIQIARKKNEPFEFEIRSS